MPSLRVRIKNQVHKGLLEQKDADRLISALDHEDIFIIVNERENILTAKKKCGDMGQVVYHCPKCNGRVSTSDHTRYCKACGQRISFPKEE